MVSQMSQVQSGVLLRRGFSLGTGYAQSLRSEKALNARTRVEMLANSPLSAVE